jgi:hypothetical protein
MSRVPSPRKRCIRNGIGEREILWGLEAAADAGGDGKAAWFVIYTPDTGASL